MADTASFPNYQDQPAGAIPVYIVSGGSPVAPNSPYLATPLGYQQLPVSTPAVGLTVPTGATFCYITVVTADVMYRDDGTDPTATVGMPIALGTQNFLYAGNLAAIRFISTTGTAVLNVLYYK